MDAHEGVFVAFDGSELLLRGAMREVVVAAKKRHDRGSAGRLALFDDRTGRPVDVDYRGTDAEVIARLMPTDADRAPETPKRRGPGRPRLGVVSREISLLPRHWSWLSEQRGGASATLRRLVDAARKAGATDDRIRRAVDAAHRFLWDMAGDQPGFEEATRALFAHDFETFREHTRSWPEGVREQAWRYVDRAREGSSQP